MENEEKFYLTVMHHMCFGGNESFNQYQGKSKNM